MSWICNRFFFSNVSVWLCVCSFLHLNCLPGEKSANYNIKAVFYQWPFCICSVCYYTQSKKVSGGRGSHAKQFFFILCCLFAKLDCITPVHRHMEYYPYDFASDVALCPHIPISLEQQHLLSICWGFVELKFCLVLLECKDKFQKVPTHYLTLFLH